MSYALTTVKTTQHFVADTETGFSYELQLNPQQECVKITPLVTRFQLMNKNILKDNFFGPPIPDSIAYQVPPPLPYGQTFYALELGDKGRGIYTIEMPTADKYMAGVQPRIAIKPLPDNLEHAGIAASIKAHLGQLPTDAEMERLMTEVNQLVGLELAKKDFYNNLFLARVDQAKEEMGIADPEKISRHMAFLGNPGTGKTTMAGLVANIYYALGLVRKPKVIEVRVTDLINSIGGSPLVKIQRYIDDAIEEGCILFIDEAHTLSETNVGQALLKTLVPAMENHRDKFIVIMAGYTEPMKELISLDQGLKSRISNFVRFEDYSIPELGQILDRMLEKRNYQPLAADTREYALRLLEKEKKQTKANFGNARSARLLIDTLRKSQAKRIETEGLLRDTSSSEEEFSKALTTFTLADIKRVSMTGLEKKEMTAVDQAKVGEAYSRIDRLIGLDEVKRDFKRNMSMANLRALQEEVGVRGADEVSRHMVFTGPPGTGKTTVAEQVAMVYYALGFISSPSVHKVTKADLVASYVGQTAPKTRAAMEKARGGILFIEEAGDLASNAGSENGAGTFDKEAIDALAEGMEDMRDDLVVIAAGHLAPIQKLLAMNDGLKSRLKTFLNFEHYDLDQLGDIMDLMLAARGYQIEPDARDHALGLLEKEKLESGDRFANAREVRNLIESADKYLAERLEAGDQLRMLEGETTATTKARLSTLTLADVKPVQLSALRGGTGVEKRSIGFIDKDTFKPANDQGQKASPSPQAKRGL